MMLGMWNLVTSQMSGVPIRNIIASRNFIPRLLKSKTQKFLSRILRGQYMDSVYSDTSTALGPFK